MDGWCATRMSSTNRCFSTFNRSANSSRGTGCFSRLKLWSCSRKCSLMHPNYSNATKPSGLTGLSLSAMSARSLSSWSRGINWHWLRASSITRIYLSRKKSWRITKMGTMPPEKISSIICLPIGMMMSEHFVRNTIKLLETQSNYWCDHSFLLFLFYLLQINSIYFLVFV